MRAGPGLKPTAARDYGCLLEATSHLLAALAQHSDDRQALLAAFEAVAQGFAAQKALLLEVVSPAPCALRALGSLGPFSSAQVAACERGESISGVSASVIQRVIATRQPELIADPRLLSASAVTPALSASPFSVLCAPLLDVLQESVLAVVYLQQGAVSEAYDEADLVWLSRYAAAAAQVFAYHLRSARERARLEGLVSQATRGVEAPEILGDSAHTQALRRSLHQIFIPALEVDFPEPVLLLGEPGTGKDLVARYLHGYSSRASRPFVVASCAELTDELAAARLFGHKRGAFTGALSDEPGFFRAAQRGVLFLDEVGELTPRAQAQLLRVLESHTLVPVGQTQEHKVDVAVVLATNRELAEDVRAGRFRADLFDRISALTLRLAPLRERPWDVPALLEHYRRVHEARYRKRTLGFAPEAVRALAGFSWPGNVRQLARLCSLLVLHAQAGERIHLALVEQCLPELRGAAGQALAAALFADQQPFQQAVRAFERELILARLERCGGDVQAARQSLGLTRSTFHRYRRRLGIPCGDEDA